MNDLEFYKRELDDANDLMREMAEALEPFAAQNKGFDELSDEGIAFLVLEKYKSRK